MFKQVLGFSLVSFLAFILGAAIVFLPAKLLIAFIIVLALVIVVFYNPWLAAIIALGFVSGLDLPGFFPQFSLMGGKIKPSDVFLVLSIFFLFVFFRREFRHNIKAMKEVFVPLAIIFLFVVLSSVNAFLFFDTSIKHILGEFRHWLYWLLLPIFTFLVIDDTRYQKVILFIFFMACIAVVFQILQGVGGVALSNNVRELKTMGDASEVVRTNIGIFLIGWSFLILIATYLYRYLSFIRLMPLLSVISIGLLVTYTKSFWAGIFISTMLLLRRFSLSSQVKMLVQFVLLCVVLLLVLLLAKPQIINSVIDRVAVIGEEVSSGHSLEWRLYENERAMESIVQYPLGVGIGSVYREVTMTDLNLTDMQRYIHNSYLYLMVKLGILALPLVLFLLYKISAVSLDALKNLSQEQNIVSRIDSVLFITYSPFVIGILIYSIFTPTLMNDAGIAILASISGIVLGRHYRLVKLQ